MRLQQVAPQTVMAAAVATAATMGGIKRFAKLERVLAAVCALTPALLIAGDGGNVRDSISAYYDMARNQFFYVPLTVAAMLFVVNGLVKERRVYNTVLGALLAGLVLADHDTFPSTHMLFAGGFFVGNAVVILLYSSKKERWFKGVLVGLITVAMAATFLFGWISLFWAEWLSLLIISLHYVLESLGVID